MDLKSLAKSKRAHSQHHSKKHHSNQKPKAPSAGSTEAASPNKPPSKQLKQKAPHFQSPSGLSSNWDRYEEDFDLEIDKTLHNSHELSDVVRRKSKGADFSYLISEAKSQFHATSSSVSFPSFDDIFNVKDFNQEFGALVSVRGESYLSQIQNDNFIIEDQSSLNHEATFLSLDLKSIEKQLEKVDLSQRLFIDQDQDFMLLQEFNTATEAFDQDIEIAVISSDSSASTSVSGISATTTFPSREPNIHSVPNPNQSVAAEAELDMLLDSFSDINFLGSSGQSVMNQTGLDGQDLANSRLASNLDSVIDDLLDETSTPVHKEIEGSAIDGPDLSKSVLGSNLDDSIDDLLNDTSSFSLINKGGPAEVLSKPLDDFDSWLDTI